MYGLIMLVGFIVYCLLCYGFVRVIAAIPPRGRRGRRWLYGLVAFLVFNAPLGYQFVPAMIKQSYLCRTEAGFELYKTPQQWRQENPIASKTLAAYADVRQENRRIAEGHSQRIFHLNERFDWVIDLRWVAKNLVREEQTVVDIATGEVMARRMDFAQQGIGFLGGGTVSDCFRKDDRARWLVDGEAFYSIYLKFKDIQENES